MERINVGKILFDNVTLNDAINNMQECISKYDGRKASFLCVANQDSINNLEIIEGKNKGRINEAFLTIPDGYSVIYASKFLGHPLKTRVAGPDLMEKFMEVSAKLKYKNFFLGAAEGVASLLADKMKAKYAGLKISGIYSPPFGEFSTMENNKIIKMINKSKSDALWVSFGCPKQEKWILDNKDKLNVPIAIGIGAAFNFLSGAVKRAPVFLQKLRLEWFYRIFKEPKRLWRRYFFGGIKFAGIIIKQKYVHNKE